MHVTQLEVKQGRWVIGNIGSTRHGQEHLTKLARDIIADNERLYASQQSDESDPNDNRLRLSGVLGWGFVALPFPPFRRFSVSILFSVIYL